MGETRGPFPWLLVAMMAGAGLIAAAFLIWAIIAL